MGCAMAWCCYWIGHSVWVVGDAAFGKRMPGWWYRLYSTFMVWSDYWQGDGERGPWQKID